MLGRLTERWSYLAKLRENPSFDEDNADSQEVLDDVIIRVAAREYLDTLKVGHSKARRSWVTSSSVWRPGSTWTPSR
jgi:hypothetical protein